MAAIHEDGEYQFIIFKNIICLMNLLGGLPPRMSDTSEISLSPDNPDINETLFFRLKVDLTDLHLTYEPNLP